MFNRQAFNRGKFNRNSGNVNVVLLHGDCDIVLAADGRLNATMPLSGQADIVLATDGPMNMAAAFDGMADIVLAADATVTRARPFDGVADIVIFADGQLVRAKHLSGASVIALGMSSAGFNTFGYETISLTRPGFIFRPGDEIIIDMENMTVTMNGQNIMRFVDRESEFFEFNPGNNEVTFETTTAAGRVDMRVLWKDRWK